MTLDEAYQRLGLEPLDEHIHKMLQENRRAGLELYRRLGATTWMLVTACLKMMDGKDVLLIGAGHKETTRWLVEARGFLRSLGAGSTVLDISGLRFIFGSKEHERGSIQTRHSLGILEDPDRVIYQDRDWAGRIQRRAQGPFAMIREIRLIHGNKVVLPNGLIFNDQYLAYAEDNEFLMAVTEERACELVLTEGVIPIGFKPVAPELPSIRGSFSLGGVAGSTSAKTWQQPAQPSRDKKRGSRW